MKSILVIDDDKQIRESLKIVLEREKHIVFLAENGSFALEIAKNNKLDLIITDIVMPGKDGLEVIMYFKKQLPETPIIAMSGGGRFGDTDNYLKLADRLGATKIFNKPFNLKEFIDFIHEILLP